VCEGEEAKRGNVPSTSSWRDLGEINHGGRVGGALLFELLEDIGFAGDGRPTLASSMLPVGDGGEVLEFLQRNVLWRVRLDSVPPWADYW